MSALTSFADDERWVAWRNEKRGEKLTKVPYGRDDRKAKSDDPGTWLARSQALATERRIRNGHGSGIGIELGDIGADLHLGGGDLDSCLRDGAIAPWAAAILDVVQTYTEISPSETGLKFFFYASSEDVRWFLHRIGVSADGFGCRRGVPGEDERNHGPAVEVYLARRYFAVTEKPWPGTPDRIRVLDRADLDRLTELVPPLKSATAGRTGGDNSRSAIAFRKVADLRRSGAVATVKEMVAALLADPEAADWVREKGEAHGGRELQRLWDRTAGGDHADAAAFSDDALALEFAGRHAGTLRYTAAFSRWYIWTGTYWRADDTLAAFDCAREVCREASGTLSAPRDAGLARSVASAKTVAAVAKLAAADRTLATEPAMWDRDPLLFNTPEEEGS
jgi:putative DNA primase/helicase